MSEMKQDRCPLCGGPNECGLRGRQERVLVLRGEDCAGGVGAGPGRGEGEGVRVRECGVAPTVIQVQASALITGARDSYRWLTSPNELDQFLDLFPDAVLGKYLAVTSSIAVSLEVSEGIESSVGTPRRIAYSPLIRSDELPNRTHSDCDAFTSGMPSIHQDWKTRTKMCSKPDWSPASVQLVNAHSERLEVSPPDDRFAAARGKGMQSDVSAAELVTFVTRNQALFRAAGAARGRVHHS